ncbi:MAG: hypothetical protein ACYCZH_03545 [Sulfuriferula sp.]
MDNKIYDESRTKVTEPVAKDVVANDSRRRFTKTGLGTGAVIATLASQPVLAGQCLSPSGFQSGNLSSHGQPVSVGGNSPQTWAGIPPAQYPGGNVEFTSVFANGAFVAYPTNGFTLKDSMNASDNGNSGTQPQPLAKEFAAAWLNIRAGKYASCGAVLDDKRLLIIWNEYAANGQYEVMAGVFWNANQLVAYLQSIRS